MNGWKADDHQFGRGKVHLIKEKPDSKYDDYDPTRRQKLLCGRWVDATPGKPISISAESQITCGGCLNKKISLEEEPIRQARHEEMWAQSQAEREKQQAEWRVQRREAMRERYERPDWGPLRQKVLKRDKYVCQGCQEREATVAHHLTYDHFGAEFLFELVAVCSKCHARIHPHLQGEE
jgi:hypothetical protein